MAIMTSSQKSRLSRARSKTRLSHRVRREVQIEERVVFFLPGREEELPGKNRIAFGEHSDICPKG